jgi:hypothetical protein
LPHKFLNNLASANLYKITDQEIRHRSSSAQSGVCGCT